MNHEPKFTQHEIERAKLYTTHLIHEIETALIGEIEKLEGKVPTNEELAKYGTQVLHQDLSMEYKWKGNLIVRVKPAQTNAEGQRGVMLEIYGENKDE